MADVKLVVNLNRDQFMLMLDIVNDHVIVWPNDEDEFFLSTLPKLLFRLVKDPE